MVQEARAGARGRQQSASAATTGRAAGALHTAETGVAKVARRWNNSCGTDIAARGIGTVRCGAGCRPFCKKAWRKTAKTLRWEICPARRICATRAVQE